MILSKKQLAVTLSRLQQFEKPSARLEQYPTDSEIAAEVLWFAYQNHDIEGKIIADLGCGSGILGIGAMFFEPKEVFFVDIDSFVLRRLEDNIMLNNIKIGHDIICSDVKKFQKKVDVVLENPPFGVQNEHADKVFLEQAFKISDVIYSFHKLTSDKFIDAISKDNNFRITHFFKFDFPLKRTQAYHTRDIHRIGVGCWRLERQD